MKHIEGHDYYGLYCLDKAKDQNEQQKSDFVGRIQIHDGNRRFFPSKEAYL